MNAVFLDTVGLLALWDASDQWHKAAADAFGKLVEARTRLITTSYVLLECGNAMARDPDRSPLLVLKSTLEAGNLLVIPSAGDWSQAWKAYEEGFAERAGIVDQISFAVMRRYGLRKAFTNDNHFRAAGLEVLF